MNVQTAPRAGGIGRTGRQVVAVGVLKCSVHKGNVLGAVPMVRPDSERVVVRGLAEYSAPAVRHPTDRVAIGVVGTADRIGRCYPNNSESRAEHHDESNAEEPLAPGASPTPGALKHLQVISRGTGSQDDELTVVKMPLRFSSPFRG